MARKATASAAPDMFAPAPVKVSPLPHGTFRVTDWRKRLWEPKGPVQCAGCGACDWWRDGERWQCSACNPKPDAMTREGFRLAFRGDAIALDRASAAGGAWITSNHLADTPMAAWRSDQWRDFVAAVCGGYVLP